MYDCDALSSHLSFALPGFGFCVHCHLYEKPLDKSDLLPGDIATFHLFLLLVWLLPCCICIDSTASLWKYHQPESKHWWMSALAADAAILAVDQNHCLQAQLLTSWRHLANILFGGKNLVKSEIFPTFPPNLFNSGPVEMNMLRCNLNKSSQRMGNHGKGSWMNLARSCLFELTLYYWFELI